MKDEKALDKLLVECGFSYSCWEDIWRNGRQVVEYDGNDKVKVDGVQMTIDEAYSMFST